MRCYSSRECTRHRNIRWCVISILLLVLSVADLLINWLLYADVSRAEKGLVFGPPEEAVINALLIFSILGTLTFAFEGVNLFMEMCQFREKICLDGDMVSAIVIWVVDLPQIAINLHIARCREDPISVFQLSKASIVLISLVIRIIISSVKYCNKKAREEADTNWHVAYRVLIFFGLLFNVGCAIAVFIFTQMLRGSDGVPQIQVPDTVFEDKYNDQRYFQNVSIFVHHPDFDVNVPSNPANFKANWVRFMSINDIRNRSDVHISYNYIYEKTATDLKLALFVKEDKTGNGQTGSWGVSECYTMDLTNHMIADVSNVKCQASFFSPQARSVYVTFSFIRPAGIFRRRIFGDIQYNVKVREQQACNDYSGDGISDSVSADHAVPSIHYFRTSADFSPRQLRHLVVEEAGTGAPRFYSNDGRDLQDIATVWKTGYSGCQSSGSLAPNFRDTIPVHCSNTAVAFAG